MYKENRPEGAVGGGACEPEGGTVQQHSTVCDSQLFNADNQA